MDLKNKFDLKSRKLLASIFGVMVLFVGWCITAHWTALAPQFQVFKDGVVMIISAYLAGNAAHHFADAYANKDSDKGSA